VQKTDWFASTIREFRRSYGEQHAVTQERAIKVFAHLLKTSIFKGWDVVDEQPSTMTSNHSIIFKGAFSSLASHFPSRVVYMLRILWEDEERKDATIDGDLAIEYRLTLVQLIFAPTQKSGAPPLMRRTSSMITTLQLSHSICCMFARTASLSTSANSFKMFGHRTIFHHWC
jgi:hypothetical protein